MAQTVLRIDASGTGDASVTRKLNDQVIARFDGADVITRDLAADPLPFVDAKWNAIRGLTDDQLSDDDKSRLALSDTLIDEIRRADTLVISVPMYNFSIPAALKAWIDLVARPGRTFSWRSGSSCRGAFRYVLRCTEPKRANTAFSSPGSMRSTRFCSPTRSLVWKPTRL